MKHLLNGVAIAAVLAIAAPAWAQAPAAAPAKTAPAAMAPAPSTKAAMAPKAKRPMRHHAAMHGKMHKASAGDQMTEQLNREELARIQGAAPPAPPAPPPTAPDKTPR